VTCAYTIQLCDTFLRCHGATFFCRGNTGFVFFLPSTVGWLGKYVAAADFFGLASRRNVASETCREVTPLETPSYLAYPYRVEMPHARNVTIGQDTSADPLRSVRCILGIGFLASIALTPKLWLNSRTPPCLPLLPFIKPFPWPIDVACLAALILCLCYTLIRPSAIAILTIAALVPVLAVQDQARIMPWLCQFFLMYLVLGTYLRKAPSSEGARTALNLLGLITICMYFWSGILKINPAFFFGIVPFLFSPLSNSKLPLEIVMPFVGVAAPFIEAGLALALIPRLTRKIAVIGIVCMHLLILLAIGPLGLSYNSSVWPWNIMMMLLVPAIFWRNTLHAREIFSLRRDITTALVLVAAGALPALRVINLWDTYPSFGMYVGNIANAVISIDQTGIDHVPENIRKHARWSSSPRGHFTIDAYDWFLAELNSPPYPEPRAFRALGQWWCSRGLPADSISVEILYWRSPFQRYPSSSYYECVDGKLALKNPANTSAKIPVL
jgi:hypothetical protein